MRDLLDDKRYKEYLLQKPKLPAVARDPSLSPPWVIYVQMEADGRWRRKSFNTYREAFQFFKKLLPRAHDLAFNNKRIPQEPPTRLVRIKGKYVMGSDGVKRQATKVVRWQPKLGPDEADHEWCMYCRRPTLFRFYSRHHALKNGGVDGTVRRCCICGASERIALLPRQRRP